MSLVAEGSTRLHTEMPGTHSLMRTPH
jgi:hypothetical protein